MTEHVKTIETQAFQIWLNRSLEDLGWPGPHGIGSAFVKPFDSWCDMSHTLAEEDWVAPAPAAVLYFCGAMAETATPAARADPAYPGRRAADAKAGAQAFLARSARHLFPGACGPDGVFRWDLLIGPNGDADAASGAAALDDQVCRANVNPSDRYVLALPGSSAHRISPLDDTFDNLTIAGDWTQSGLNFGCVESAMMSGRLAAHALGAGPPLEDIIGYDHP
jgi:hypothetical protein